MSARLENNLEFDVTLPDVAASGGERRAFPQGHPLGVCYEDPINKVIYLNIPKTATTTLKDWCERNGFRRTYEYQKRPVPNDYVIFCVLRHPVTRYISGALQYYKRNRERFSINEFIDRQIQKIKFKECLILDAHTTPQCVFITKNFQINEFLIMENLHNDIENFIYRRKYTYDKDLPRMNMASNEEMNTFRKEINSSIVEYIKEFYFEDMNLYRNCLFDRSN